MTGQLDQPSAKADRPVETAGKFSLPIETPLDSRVTQARAEQSELKLQGDKMEVPQLTVKGWEGSATAGNTNLPKYLDLTNPYQSWSLDVAGRKWTDSATSSHSLDSTRFERSRPVVDTDRVRSGNDLGSGPAASRYELENRRVAWNDNSGRNTYDGQQDLNYRPAVFRSQFEQRVDCINDRYSSRDSFSAMRADQRYGNQDYRDFRGRSDWSGSDTGQYGDQGSNPMKIVFNAIEGVGKALWALTPFRNSVKNGRLGCAASVSEVLQRSGYDYANHAGVGGLDVQLQRNGWTRAPLSEASPGDVVIVGRSRGWRAGGGNAHTGIVGENGSVYHNSSSRGEWIKDNLQARFGRGGENFVLKPPGNASYPIDERIFQINPEPSAIISPVQRQWTASADQYSDQQGPRTRGYQNRDTRYGDESSPGYARQDRYQADDSSRYARNDRFRPQYDSSSYQDPSSRYNNPEQDRNPRYDRRQEDDQMARQQRRHERLSRDRSERTAWRENEMFDRLRRRLRV
ncbi:MAG: hypothetical protein SGJ27_09135 [Candidatus Melainabacteria bacterium]|nr:hypothetical protein [Candidatus Melainabacteria bacterium]